MTLAAAGLECARGNRTLFRGIDFELAAGALLMVRGANGSGKTTLLRTIAGLASPQAGVVRWRGSTIASLGDGYRAELAYVGHQNALKDDLSALENLRIAAELAGHRVTAAVARAALAQLGLERQAELPASALSQGQKRRAALARLVCLERCPLWVLDEPMAALDAEATQSVSALIGAQLARGGIVVLTTHQEVALEAAHQAELILS